MTAILRTLLALFSSFGLVIGLLVYLAGLTFFGTLYQVDHGLHEAQQRFFDSWFVTFPLPGGQFAMVLLAINLVVGGIVRLRYGSRTAGVLIVHLGVLMMLVAGWVKYYHSREGFLKLHEGEESNEYISHHDWELVIATRADDGRTLEHTVAGAELQGVLHDRFTVDAPDVPFDVVVSDWLDNAQVTAAAPFHETRVVDDGRVLLAGGPAGENRVFPGCRARIEGAGVEPQRVILWGRDARPLVVTAAGKRWYVSLRERTWPMPFTIRLAKFVKEDHPGTDKPLAFVSEVVRIEGDELTPVRIEMNEPLRHKGVIAFQSGWGPQNGEREPPYTILQIVENPSDQWPLYSCIVIAIGMAIHFLRKLFAYAETERKRLLVEGIR